MSDVTAYLSSVVGVVIVYQSPVFCHWSYDCLLSSVMSVGIVCYFSSIFCHECCDCLAVSCRERC